MTEDSSSTPSSQRAQQVCAFGLAVQLIVFAAVTGVAVWSKSAAITAEALYLGGARGTP